MDIETLRALEDAILVFPGTVMVVSHDRWFLDRIATHILSFENEQPEFYEGNYAEYEAYRLARLGDCCGSKAYQIQENWRLISPHKKTSLRAGFFLCLSIAA